MVGCGMGRDIARSCFLGNEWFVVWCVSPLERGSRGVLRWGARHGVRWFCCCLVRWYFLALGDCFDFRRLCAGVTHPRPLSRGEILDAAFFLIISGLLCWNSPLERGGLGSYFWLCVAVLGRYIPLVLLEGWGEVGCIFVKIEKYSQKKL